MNKFLAACLLVIAVFPLIPVVGALKYDGLVKILEWPPVFYWFVGIAALIFLLSAYLFLNPQRVGAEVSFEEGGFVIEVRRFFFRDINHRLAWSEIEEMKLVEAPRGGDFISFRLSYDAAIQHGLIQPTTRENASKKRVTREVLFPPKLSSVSPKEAVLRFQASAKQAGAKLVETKSLNLVVFERKVWSVTYY